MSKSIESYGDVPAWLFLAVLMGFVGLAFALTSGIALVVQYAINAMLGATGHHLISYWAAFAITIVLGLLGGVKIGRN